MHPACARTVDSLLPPYRSLPTTSGFSRSSSFAFGWGVNYEDAYLHRIVEGLRVPGKQVELVKLGTPGSAL